MLRDDGRIKCLRGQHQYSDEKVYVVPNCLDLTHNQWSQIKEKNETVKIGWVGGITHEEDLKLIADDINAMDVEFYIVGYTPSEHWNNIVKLIPKAKIVEGTSPADLANINNGAISMAFPIAKTVAIKDACDHFGAIFGCNLNRKDVIPFQPDQEIINIKTNFHSIWHEIWLA